MCSRYLGRIIAQYRILRRSLEVVGEEGRGKRGEEGRGPWVRRGGGHGCLFWVGEKGGPWVTFSSQDLPTHHPFFQFTKGRSTIVVHQTKTFTPVPYYLPSTTPPSHSLLFISHSTSLTPHAPHSLIPGHIQFHLSHTTYDSLTPRLIPTPSPSSNLLLHISAISYSHITRSPLTHSSSYTHSITIFKPLTPHLSQPLLHQLSSSTALPALLGLR
ncbi:hypothetical protein Pmani_017865 [Petrolisthes manimaculis]|uniref:Uncharacterized protein n=1 Tax=Petrolisthes manimaculis TaxID=1843537 RepID=A0AAE1PKY9_9EUCA|nr:hypothetical protein Pmani_017865 [Petrolisthes manimaculis]